MINIIGIYKITSPSGKIYIGQSINIILRWKLYRDYIEQYKRQRKLYNSVKKYGWENHQKEILEECSENLLLERETYWKNYYRVLETPSLCCRLDGKGGRLSEETKQNISKSLKGRKNKNKGQKRPKISEILKGRKIPSISKVIIQFDMNMNLINEFPSKNEAARQLKLNRVSIGLFVGKDISYKGYFFKYKDYE